MIQRIQSIFLLDSVIVSILLLFMPFEFYCVGENNVKITLSPFDLKEGESSLIFVPMALNFLVLMLSFINIFLFKNRKKQMALCNISMLFSAVLLVILLLLNYYTIEGATRVFEWVVGLPFLNIVFCLLAKRFIKKDDDLIRSADRIR